ncbi:signal peptide-containing protein [Rhodopirellula sp. SWK7]|uniref:signal peptide-containing protein n=1 Tax=Rhodopirellula sp. SWK7 TaxID=595460 RepID=UPI0002BE8481|nr:signal peptide-containing protein [Rhodopirellula sp. SWK7]EMI46387.1 signal peptide-containing protein [Rhodopirellula sp. SWK7]
MLRKLFLAGTTFALLSGITLATPIGSYARCGWNYLTDSAGDAVPLEWELKRARQMIVDLQPEIQNNARRIAQEKIEVVRLERQLGETDMRLAKAQSEIERLSDDLRDESPTYSYGGKTYTSVQVKSDLGNRFKRFKTRQQTSDKLQKMLSARQASLRAASERMEAMLDARRQLEVEVENLQARLGALRVAQTSSQLNLDDSALSRSRELLDEIAMRIDVEEETMKVDVEYFGEIDLEEPSDENLLEDISAYMNGINGAGSDALVSIDLSADSSL